MGGFTQTHHLLVGVATMLHFLVDGLCLCCAYLLTTPFTLPHLAGVFITYNTIAFLTQPLTGYMADKFNNRHWMLIAATTCLSITVLLTPLFIPVTNEVSAFAIAVLLGIGNSLFHVWGGKQVVIQVGNDIRALGMFVSTGVFGLSVAIVFWSWVLLYVFIIAICVLTTAYILIDARQSYTTTTVSRHIRQHVKVSPFLVVVAVIAFVMLRSYIGTGLTSTATGPMVILATGLTAMLGKMAGGWIALRCGLLLTLGVMATTALVCILSGNTALAVILVGLFTINCTMPITLFLANDALRGREGFAFGLLAAALMPGYLIKS